MANSQKALVEWEDRKPRFGGEIVWQTERRTDLEQGRPIELKDPVSLFSFATEPSSFRWVMWSPGTKTTFPRLHCSCTWARGSVLAHRMK